MTKEQILDLMKDCYEAGYWGGRDCDGLRFWDVCDYEIQVLGDLFNPTIDSKATTRLTESVSE